MRLAKDGKRILCGYIANAEKQQYCPAKALATIQDFGAPVVCIPTNFDPDSDGVYRKTNRPYSRTQRAKELRESILDYMSRNGGSDPTSEPNDVTEGREAPAGYAPAYRTLHDLQKKPLRIRCPRCGKTGIINSEILK